MIGLEAVPMWLDDFESIHAWSLDVLYGGHL
jgi:hypothetical protein